MIKKRSLLFYWEMTQLVKEVTNPCDVVKFIKENFDESMEYNIFKTSKDEVLQIYNDVVCYTVIGGSSADKKEWKSNFNVGKLVHGFIHEGFYNLAVEVLHSKNMVHRPTMIYGSHSRGAVAVSIICFLRKVEGFGFGTPKAFKKWKDIPSFTNVFNPLDPVCHVVPFFKRVGKVVKVRFLRNPHTRYDKVLERKGL